VGARFGQAPGQVPVVDRVGLLVQRGETQYGGALFDETADGADQPVGIAALVEVGDDRDDAATRVVHQTGGVVRGSGDVRAAPELDAHQQLDRVGDVRGEVDDLGVEGDEVGAKARKAPQAGGGDGGV